MRVAMLHDVLHFSAKTIDLKFLFVAFDDDGVKVSWNTLIVTAARHRYLDITQTILALWLFST